MPGIGGGGESRYSAFLSLGLLSFSSFGQEGCLSEQLFFGSGQPAVLFIRVTSYLFKWAVQLLRRDYLPLASLVQSRWPTVGQEPSLFIVSGNNNNPFEAI